MSLLKTKPLHLCTTPHEALAEMCVGFNDAGALVVDCEAVKPEEMPAPYRQMLVHEEHMTHALRRFHHKPVDLYVMEAHHENDLYSRKIFLTKANTAYTVEYGLVRLDLRYVEEEVRKEILKQKTPLGAVLTNFNVLRRIEPKWFLRFPQNSTVLNWMGDRDRKATYGRLGTIYCNHEPAVEVLEIVTGV